MYLTGYIYVYISQLGIYHFIFFLLFQLYVKIYNLNNEKNSLVLFLKYKGFFPASNSALIVVLELVTLFFFVSYF